LAAKATAALSDPAAAPAPQQASLAPTIISYFEYHECLKLVNKPTVNLENIMSKTPVKATLTAAMIKE
tara:strand:- start:566 stop:769 length:204 start_codon:yes stop_codon:yes gene_type:complete